MSNKSVTNLFELQDDPVIKVVQETFTHQLMFSPSVHSIFFSAAGAPAFAAADPAWVDDIAAALVCSSISNTSLYGFSSAVDQAEADSFWQKRLTAGEPSAVQASQTLYQWAFPAYCQADGMTFQDYLADDPESWGQQLAAKCKEDSFINTTINEIIAADPNWLQRLNLVFYKIDRLNSSQLPGVVEAWTNAFPEKGIIQQWKSYNFVPSDLFQSDQYLSQVNVAISKSKTVGIRDTRCVAVVHGEAVADFLNGKAKSIGLRTQSAFHNSKIECGFSASVAGSPLLLANGETIPIEEARKGHEILTRDGAVAAHCGDRVMIDFDHAEPIYGINEYEPFFSAGHLFLTREGWKAKEPTLVREENPSRKIAGELAVGDVVFRVASREPFAYEEVEIERISSRKLVAGDQLYGLYLHGARSYHVHGFCVAMN